MSHEHREGSFHGDADDVVRQLLNEVILGNMEQDQFIELVRGLAGQKTHDVSTTFRCALIAQGFEPLAMDLKEIHMTLTTAGAMFQYTARQHGSADWLDSLTAEQEAAMMQASVWTLRAGNVNASPCPEGGAIHIDGPILRDDEEEVDEEELVAEFLSELEAEYPTMPKDRRSRWW